MVKPTYVFQEKDLPLVLLYQCDVKDLTQLCLRPLAAGQTEEGSGTERQNGGEGDAN
jgi:hypothetical protein